MISAASTAARLRAPAAAMLPERRVLPSGSPGRGKAALEAPRLRAKPRGLVSNASIVVGAALATTAALSTSSSSSSLSCSSSSSSRLPPPPPPQRRSRAVAARAAPPSSTSEPALLVPGPEEDAWQPGDPVTPFMENSKRWLERDLPHLFDDIGIDKSGYAEVVEFRDPITSVSLFECLPVLFTLKDEERRDEEQKDVSSHLLSLSSPPKKNPVRLALGLPLQHRGAPPHLLSDFCPARRQADGSAGFDDEVRRGSEERE